MNPVFRTFFLLMALMIVPQSVGAIGSPWQKSDQGQLRLLSAVEAVNGQKTVKLGLHFQLNDDWKIYWRNPGDAGFPPNLTTEGSENLEAVSMAWPVPERFSVLGLDSFGYKKEVVLPLTATLSDPDQPLILNARLEYLICAEICVPAEADLDLVIPAGGGGPSQFAHLINQYDARVPPVQAEDGPTRSGLWIQSAVLDENKTLTVRVANEQPFLSPDLLVEGPTGMLFGKPKATVSGDRRLAALSLSVDDKYAKAPLTPGDALVLTVIDSGRGVEKQISVAVPDASQPMAGIPSGPRPEVETAGQAADATGPDLALLLLFALLGGVILNLMPCVLPVLSLKLMDVVRMGGREHGHIRQGFLATAAGILVSFMMLAGGLAALKASGAYVGWGIQFQQPAFLVAMAVIMTLFVASMWGLFHFQLPGAVAHLGEKAFHVRGLAGHFMTGMFATLMATPCSAPFLGTAVGFALSQGPGEIFLIFLLLGLGLALPYLLVAAFPGLAAWLPRPGRWMVYLQRILGLVLAGFILWLVGDVLNAQVGAVAAAVVGGSLLAMIAVMAVGRQWSLAPKAGGLAVLLVAAFLAPGLLAGSPSPSLDEDEKLWVAFDRSRIDSLVAEGKTVFVDVTAEWCITCKANKQVAFSDAALRLRLEQPGMVAMKADWTLPDPAINDFLGEFGRSGIPFNVVFGPGAPAGVTLPELLTPGLVMGALDKAEGVAPIRAAVRQ